jgi:hypothetical protein
VSCVTWSDKNTADIKFRWNRDLAYQRALHMGSEFKNKGVNIALGPVVGPIGRIAEGGRNWEGISNDPYLCGALAFETVRGIQENGVMTSTKHYIGNEQGMSLGAFRFWMIITDHLQSSTATQARTTRAKRLSLYRATSMTRPCMNFIYGRSKTRSRLDQATLCALTIVLTIPTAARIAKY